MRLGSARMKERVTLTLDNDVLKQVDGTVDGFKIKNRSHAIELLLLQAMGSGKPRTAVVLAGGAGTRLRPITHEIPKPMLPVHDRTILEHNFDLLKKYGIRHILLSIGYKGDKIKEHFGNGKNFGVEITYLEETKPLGTAGPLNLAKPYITETFVTCNADELKEINLYDMYLFHKENNSVGTIALFTVQDPSAYGVARLHGNKIQEFVEKPKPGQAPSNLINAGLYMFEPEVLDYIPKGQSMLEKDVFPKLAKEGKLAGFPFSGQWFDTGTMERYEKALKEWKGIE